MKPETIKKLLDDGMTSSELVVVLETYNNVKEQIEHHQRQIEITTKKHKEELDGLYSAIRNVRKSCPHSETKYVPDASGNNDSYYLCTACGVETRRLEVKTKSST